jgi:FkbH-like protein
LQSERRAAQAQATDLDGYLKSLAMVLVCKKIGPMELPRAAQLVNKSNQFNLTTRRYTEAELERLLKADGTIGFSFRLMDRFGDNGLICVIIARPDGSWGQNYLLIDTWLMSCRVLGRQVEAAALQVLGNEVAARGFSSLIGEYRPTSRNRLVEDHYSKLGFVPIPAPADALTGATFWQFDLAAMNMPTHWITVETGKFGDEK